MSILDTREKSKKYNYKKTVIVYLAISVFAVVFNRVYAIFGHGVSSDAMTWMFLYPLIGGCVFYLLIGLLFPVVNRFSGYRTAYNSYNSGIAVLTVGSLLKGIMDIAGTSSSYLKVYTMAGYALIAVGLAVLIVLAVNQGKVSVRK